ncbi:MAG: AraC family ligand binding domain-containing protein, partial [Clostridia bacterium]|nr:AraC family ligand binding domain-containing protein [Clostridia bacterium]
MIAFYENRNDDLTYGRHLDGKHQLGYMPHLHYHIELVICLEGSTEAFADAERCVIEGGDAFVAFPNQIHGYTSKGRERYYIFIINPDLMPELAAVFSKARPKSPLIKGLARDPEILSLVEKLSEQKSSDPYFDVRRKGYLLSLFAKLLAHTELSYDSPDDSHALKAVVAFCTENYTKELSLSILEEKLHISKYYISHLFSDKLGLGFNDYINSLRVSFACRYLRHSDRSVTEIGRMFYAGNAQEHILKIVDVDTKADVASVTVNMAGGTVDQFTYGKLSAPVTLKANKAYYLVSEEHFDGDAFADHGFRTHSSAGASVTGGVYYLPEDDSWHPDNSPSFGFVGLDFKYTMDKTAASGDVLELVGEKQINEVLRNNFDTRIGTAFTVGAKDIYVTELGRIFWNGNS